MNLTWRKIISDLVLWIWKRDRLPLNKRSLLKKVPFLFLLIFTLGYKSQIALHLLSPGYHKIGRKFFVKNRNWLFVLVFMKYCIESLSYFLKLFMFPKQLRGLFTNNIDNILALFNHLPTPKWTFLTLSIDISNP